MSFGRPPGQLTFNPTPPERGSFPLDHDGECQPVMKDYLACLKKVRGNNDPECRMLAKAYLKCRMDHDLMAKDSFKNLGFPDEKDRGNDTSAEKPKSA
ncbi:Cytochrome c oxidase assembly protein cox19 [Orbilia brochopaga]|uniref:Cytochrome c oxidase assembly protein cox19 n=1 Tax=Orbilia brochopaga TaxID=3140254 RepID=A0AAV9U4E2_9PEZI